MRLVYVYVSNGSMGPGAPVPKWSPKNPTDNLFAMNIGNEGRYCMMQEMLRQGIIDELLVVVDSCRGMGGYRPNPQTQIVVMPSLGELPKFLRQGDVLWVRGGFKPWFPHLQKIQEMGYWIIFYRAATNRHPWPFWDVTLNDLIEEPRVVVGGKLHIPFSKPLNEDLFKPISGVKKTFDVLLNASHIHDKKGQVIFIRAASVFKKLYGRNLKICLPGRAVGHGAIPPILDEIRRNGLDVYMPGMVQRPQLVQLMNASKIFAHVGTGGQNDRGALEAMRCGCPVVIANTPAFAPFVYKNPEVCEIAPYKPSIPDLAGIAQATRRLLDRVNAGKVTNVAEYYLKENGMHQVCLPQMRKLFGFFKAHPKVDRPTIWKEYGTWI